MIISTFIKRSTLRASFISLVSFGVSAIATPAHAVAIDFSSWQPFGDVTTPGAGEANLSTNALLDDDSPASDSLFNFSGTPASQATPSPDLQDFLGITDDALNIGGIAYEGSAIKNTVSVTAGDVFSFNYNFRTNETAFSPTLNDFAFFLVNNEVFKLADINDASNPSTSFTRETGVNSYTYTFSAPGDYNLAFGVVDIDDYSITSALQVSNANIQPVPFEFSPGLGILALGAWGLAAKLSSLVRKQTSCLSK